MLQKLSRSPQSKFMSNPSFLEICTFLRVATLRKLKKMVAGSTSAG